MAWNDIGSWGSDLFNGGNFGDWGSDSFDWGSVWGDIAGDVGDSGFDWTDLVGGGDSGGGSSWGSWANTIGNLFGGGDSGGGSGWSNIFGAMLGGLAGGADAKLGLEMVREKARLEGAEERRSLGFAADLEDYFKQQDKARKRTAIDTYGQFSLMDRWAPNAQPAPAVQVPTKPVAGQGGY